MVLNCAKAFQFLYLLLGAISLGMVVVPSLKIVINLPRTYEKLPCKGEPYQFIGKRDSSLQRNKQTD